TVGGNVGDSQVDTVIVNGSSHSDQVTMLASGFNYSVVGLAAEVTVRASEATDRLTVNGLGGDDLLDAGLMPGGVAQLTLDGGVDDDTIIGGSGADILIGGDDDDLIDGNGGSDF